MRKLALMLALVLALTGFACAEQSEPIGTLYEQIAGDKVIVAEVLYVNEAPDPIAVDLIDMENPSRDFGLTAILQYEFAYAEWAEADALALIDGEMPAATVELTFDGRHRRDSRLVSRRAPDRRARRRRCALLPPWPRAGLLHRRRDRARSGVKGGCATFVEQRLPGWINRPCPGVPGAFLMRAGQLTSHFRRLIIEIHIENGRERLP